MGPGTTLEEAEEAANSKYAGQRTASEHDTQAFNLDRNLMSVLFKRHQTDYKARDGFLNAVADDVMQINGIDDWRGMTQVAMDIFATGLFTLRNNLPLPMADGDGHIVWKSSKKRMLEGAKVDECESMAIDFDHKRKVRPARAGKGYVKYARAINKMAFKRKRSFGRKKRFVRRKRGRKSYRSKKFRKSSSSKRSSFAKKVAQVMSAHRTIHFEHHEHYQVATNVKSYCNIARGHNETDSATKIFMGQNMLYEYLAFILGTVNLWAEYWILSATRYVEITNTTNVPLYMKIHKLRAKQDRFNSYGCFSDFYAREYDGGTAAPQEFPNEAQRYLFFKGDEGNFTTGFASGTPDSYTGVLQSIFNDPIFKKYIKRNWFLKSSKQILVRPQGQITFALKQTKPFLYGPETGCIAYPHAGRLTPLPVIAAGTITKLSAKIFKYVSQDVWIEVVGMTAKDALGKTVASAAGSFEVSYHDRMKFAQKLESQNYTFVMPGIVEGSTTVTSVPGNTLIFGASNNAGVQPNII